MRLAPLGNLLSGWDFCESRSDQVGIRKAGLNAEHRMPRVAKCFH